MSVASIAGEETPYIKHNGTIIYFDETTNGTAEENDFYETILGDKDSLVMEYVIVPGVGRSADYTGLDVTGKIALVRRGDNTFEEKSIIAQEKGAAGIIIYNNVSGDIKMNVGEATLAACSISQNDGEMLVAAGNGKLTIDRSQTSGPFISDFSSWGPTPSLNIKPEITAHGGNILSSVTGGGYDRLSGTSMACPNMAGVVTLLRQYVVENFPEAANDNVKVNEIVNKLVMSTADIAYNTNGQPYAVRKQGAGLANLMSAINTDAYITTYHNYGTPMDKTKLELLDDPERTGVYTMKFTVHNFGDGSLSYNLGAIVLTEGVSETLTNAGKTTVTEEAYPLEGADIAIECTAGGTVSGKKLTVKAGESADVTMTVTLTEENKQYLNDSFANGMYVEGYVTLTAASGTKVDLSIPYLAYYGDWTVAPLFDLTYYDTNADELDDAIDEEDKTKADAYATRPVGGVQDDYVSYLGSYYFQQDEDDMVIAANPNYVALSNVEGTIHALRFVWAGMLRNAQRIEIVITNDATGEVIFETVDYDVRKSYGDGAAPYPANVEIEFDTRDYNLPNNAKLTVTLTGYLDYGEDGGLSTNSKNVFTFPLTVDFEAPAVTDVEYYYEYDQTLKKNRLYAKASIYDNHYAMAAQLGYIYQTVDENENPTMEMMAFEQHMTPVYSQENSTTVVTFELTDYLFNIKDYSLNGDSYVLTVYDYALNLATYEIGLPDNFVDFYLDGLEEGLTLSPNEIYNLEPQVYPTTEWSEMLTFSSQKPSVARVVNNKIIATGSGKTVIKVTDMATEKSINIPITVLAEGDEGFMRYDKPVADNFTVYGYKTVKAYYQVDNDEKDIGDTGNTRFFEGDYNLSMYPSETVLLMVDLDAYFPKDTQVVYESSNEDIVSVDASGNVTAKAEGFGSVTAKVMMDDRSTYYSQSISIEVKDPFINTGATLTHYFGMGGVVNFPADLHLKEIGSFAFANFDYVLKNEEELAFDDATTSKQWYIGENTITKVVVPEGIEKIGAYAFANLTALEEIVLPSTLEAIEYGAFYGCSALEKITFSSENNLKIINQSAFELCNLKGTVDLSAVATISNKAFAGNKKLEKVITGDSLLSVGDYAFASCQSLEEITITVSKVKYGPYAFNGCEALTSFTVNAAVLPEGMFNECKGLKEVTIGADVKEIGEFAFRKTEVEKLTVAEGNTAFKTGTADYVLSADGSTLIAAAPSLTGEFTEATLGGVSVTAIGKGAFSHNNRITSVVLPSVTTIGEYGMGSSTRIASVTLGALTEIGEYAFYETVITQMPQMAADVTMGKYAFSHTALIEVHIPAGMTVPEGAFSQCMSLQTVTVGNDAVLEDYAFNINKDSSFNILHRDEDGERYFYYEFASAMTSLTIGDNVTIGDNCFSGNASMEAVTLGAGAKLGYMAFYNCTKLQYIDLSQVLEMGDYAFSGDVYYQCLDDSMTVAAPGPDGYYLYTYHAPAITTADLSSLTSMGQYAFAYCRAMTDVVLGTGITAVPDYAFTGCITLANINLQGVQTIGSNAFLETEQLVSLDLSAVTDIGEYAFLYSDGLTSVTLNPQGTNLQEGAFSYCAALTAVENLGASKSVGDYAFAYTGLTQADLTSVEYIGTHAFLKNQLTDFQVTLGTALTSLGENPFGLCKVAPFSQKTVETLGGKNYESYNYTYDISATVKIIDGSLYQVLDEGMELVTFAAPAAENVTLAEGTVRITAMALAGSDVKMVTLPQSLRALGHKAFYGCTNLEQVIFQSYHAPILEEEFEAVYYESMAHIPGTGNYGSYTDYDGTEVSIDGIGVVPYYMWNVGDGMYSTVYYGANFVDYVGYVQQKMIMVRPVNGTGYDNFIYGQYFDRSISGANAPDDIALAAIKAIDAIPERATYEHKPLVDAARAAYDQVATLEQQALVHNYSKLISSEQLMVALDPSATPSEGEQAPAEPAETQKSGVKAGIWVLLGAIALAVAGVFSGKYLLKNKDGLKDLKLGEKLQNLKLGEKLKKLNPVPALKKLKCPCKKKKQEDPAILSQEFPEEASEEEAPAEEAPVEELPQEEPAEEIVEEAPVQEVPTEDIPFEEAPQEPTQEKEPKEKRSIDIRTVLKWVGGVLAVGGILACTVLGARSCSGPKDAYTVNDQEGYSVSVRFDANGGLFATGTSVFMDSYKVDGLAADGSGKIQLPLIAPEDSVRGLDAFDKTNLEGHFLAGWYATRTENADGTYTYADKWDFENDRLTVDPNGDHSAAEPQITLYAMWVPLFKYEFYDVGTDTLIGELTVDPRNESSLTLPQWDESTGAIKMGQIPQKMGFTYEAMYLDRDGTQLVEGETLTHTGSVNVETGTAENPTMKLYVQWKEGTWYKITTADQFLMNANAVGCYDIQADLDFTDKVWPNNLMHGTFSGTIAGNGHTFSNITATQTDGRKTETGLFGQLAATAKITDLTLENVTVELAAGVTGSMPTNVGFLAGISQGGDVSGLTIVNGKLRIGESAMFLSENYAIGLICAAGETNLANWDIVLENAGEESWVVDKFNMVVKGDGSAELPEETVPDETVEETVPETTA